MILKHEGISNKLQACFFVRLGEDRFSQVDVGVSKGTGVRGKWSVDNNSINNLEANFWEDKIGEVA